MLKSKNENNIGDEKPDLSSDSKKPTKAIQNRRVCYDCAFPITKAEIQICPRCKSRDIDERRAQPKRTKKRNVIELPHPWTQLELDTGGTVLLSGNAGSGKSSICIVARPTRYISTEQEIEQVAHLWYRINPDLPAPLLSNCYTWEQLSQDLIGLHENDIVVVDSISQFASGDEVKEIVKTIIEQVRVAQARAIFIAQFRKDGVMLGPNELRHQVDAIATIPDDKTGLRRLAIEKNRFGSLFSKYFSLGAHGVGEEVFPNAYTVEGSAGKYGLHMYPMGGAKLTGIFKAMVESGMYIEGFASAALLCAGYKTGFAEPNDVEWRRSFAEDHGLTWIDPETAHQMIQEHIEESPRP